MHNTLKVASMEEKRKIFRWFWTYAVKIDGERGKRSNKMVVNRATRKTSVQSVNENMILFRMIKIKYK